MKKSDIYDVFDVGGVLNSQFPGYEYREAQLMMSDLVREAIEHDAIAAAEAGTGIGKSFAYLVPVLLNLDDVPEDRTVIATATINLQRQLLEKDIPALFSAMGMKKSVALVVGISQYVCLYRLAERISETPLLALDPLTDIGKMKAWARDTETGLRSDYPGRLDGELWSDVCADGDLCLGYKCPHSQECHFLKARKHAFDSQLLIVNHHILFTDSRIRLDGDESYDEEALLPPFHRLVIDEAHNIERNATDFFTDDYSRSTVIRLITRLSRQSAGARKTNLIETLAPYMPEKDLPDKILDQIAMLREKIDAADDFLMAFMRARDTSSILLKKTHQDILEPFFTLAKEIAACGSRLDGACKKVMEQNTAPQEFQHFLTKFEVYMRRLVSQTDVLGRFAELSGWGDDIHWLEMEYDARKNQAGGVHVKITPLNVSEILREALYEKLSTVVCTSATLDLQDDFTFWSSRAGLPVPGKPYLRTKFDSPFDYKHNLMLLTPMDSPEFSGKNSEEYLDYVTKTVGEAILAAGGGALVLFTSYVMLQDIYSRLVPVFAKNDLHVACQGDADRYTLLQEFKEDADSCLFATDSFWEGVDAPGDTLRLVIIVKLPFKVPTEPVYCARHERIDEDGGSGFFQLALPEAAMKLKQGFGRLLRTTEDRGIVLILDSRIVRKSYGSWMLNALPESHHPETLAENIPGKIETFLFG
ncbi:ATP-dependent DNA helicase [Parasphaerochaeta coccoides]|uniref:Helicase c2 n=1 Tax=Parasphaerochaeta coccoides (strain ATCC BAA-1237 / DSM 17374 / SPN1) TaxID=760011 RepID=F4GKU7_PARC1|nr:ATP-dependent DNA helicase [Parasphaerochaeta coccoides]AEC01860.1 helicase c2 [Parasphaerochaeta coccoides DSM 17374]